MTNKYFASKNNEKYKTLKINHSLRPAYYDDFKCIAQDCKFTCCAGWEITMNRKDYLTVRDQHGSETLNQEIKQALHKSKNPPSENLYAQLRCNANGFCPMFTEEHLCRLQIECGYQALPYVCKSFPRNKNYIYSGYMEQSLSIACEAVLELLWNLPEGIDFIAEELPKQQQQTTQLSTSSPYLYFQEIRSLCIDLLQDRRFSVGQRILLMGMFLQKLPLESYQIPNWFVETNTILAQPDIIEIAANLTKTNNEFSTALLFQNIKSIMMPMMSVKNKDLENYRLELLSDFILKIETEEQTFRLDNIKLRMQKIEELEKILNKVTSNTSLRINASHNVALYKQCKKNFSNTFGDIEYFFENLAVSIFFDEKLPELDSKESLWKSYVNFCNVYSLLRFIAITSCRESVPNQKDILFEGILFIARTLLHSPNTQRTLSDLFFENESSSLAHMSILLSQ